MHGHQRDGLRAMRGGIRRPTGMMFVLPWPDSAQKNCPNNDQDPRPELPLIDTPFGRGKMKREEIKASCSAIQSQEYAGFSNTLRAPGTKPRQLIWDQKEVS